VNVSKTKAPVVSGQGTAKQQARSCPRVCTADWERGLEGPASGKGVAGPETWYWERLLSVPPNVCVSCALALVVADPD